MYTTTTNNDTHPNGTLIKEVLAKHLNFWYLKAVLKGNIVTLNDNLLKEQGLEATLDLLSQYSRIELLDEKIKKTKPTEAPLSRFIQLHNSINESAWGNSWGPWV